MVTIGLAIKRIAAILLPRNDSGQVVHTPASVTKQYNLA